jgi:hypothetical protein
MDGDPRLHALECVDTRFDPTQAIARPLAAGGCTIHTQRTLHYAGPNTSADYRLAYALLFDLPPIIRREQREFPWQQQQQTGREARHQQWRRRGGVLIHFWRQRHRVGFKRGIVGLQTLLNRVMRKFGRS